MAPGHGKSYFAKLLLLTALDLGKEPTSETKLQLDRSTLIALSVWQWSCSPMLLGHDRLVNVTTNPEVLVLVNY